MMALTKFFVILLCSFGAWNLFYEYVLAPNTFFDQILVLFLGKTVAFFLNLFGFESYFLEAKNWLFLENKAVLHIDIPCNGQDLLALNTCVVLSFSMLVKQKIKLIAWGAWLITVLNILRIAFLAINFRYSQNSFDFNHHFIFPIFIYACIFLLWKFQLEQAHQQNFKFVFLRYFLVLVLLVPMLFTWQSRDFISQKITVLLANYNFFGFTDTLIYAFLQGILAIAILYIYFWKNLKFLFFCNLLIFLLLFLTLFTTLLYKFLGNNLLHFTSENLIYLYFSPYPLFVLFLYGTFKE